MRTRETPERQDSNTSPHASDEDTLFSDYLFISSSSTHSHTSPHTPTIQSSLHGPLSQKKCNSTVSPATSLELLCLCFVSRTGTIMGAVTTPVSSPPPSSPDTHKSCEFPFQFCSHWLIVKYAHLGKGKAGQRTSLTTLTMGR